MTSQSRQRLVEFVYIAVVALLFGIYLGSRVPSSGKVRELEDRITTLNAEKNMLENKVDNEQLNNHLNLNRMRIVCERAPDACETLE